MMTRRTFSAAALASAPLAAAPIRGLAGELVRRELPAPRTDGGMPLMAALQLGRSTREYSQRSLPAQTVGFPRA